MSVKYTLGVGGDKSHLGNTKYTIVPKTTFTAATKTLTQRWYEVGSDPKTWDVTVGKVYDDTKFYFTSKDDSKSTETSPIKYGVGADNYYYGPADIVSTDEDLKALYGTVAYVKYDGVMYGPIEPYGWETGANFGALMEDVYDEDEDGYNYFELTNSIFGRSRNLKLIGNPNLVFKYLFRSDIFSEECENQAWSYDLVNYDEFKAADDVGYRIFEYTGAFDEINCETYFGEWNSETQSLDYNGRYKDLPFAFVEFPCVEYPIITELHAQHTSIFGSNIPGGLVFCSEPGEHTIEIVTYRVKESEDGELYAYGLDALFMDKYPKIKRFCTLRENSGDFIKGYRYGLATYSTRRHATADSIDQAEGSVYAKLTGIVEANDEDYDVYETGEPPYYRMSPALYLPNNQLSNDPTIHGYTAGLEIDKDDTPARGWYSLSTCVGTDLFTRGEPRLSTIMGTELTSHGSGAGNRYSTVIGTRVGVHANDSTAIGSGIKVNGHGALAIGQSVSTGDRNMGLGYDTTGNYDLYDKDPRGDDGAGAAYTCDQPTLVSVEEYDGVVISTEQRGEQIYSEDGSYSPIACMPTVIGNGGVDENISGTSGESEQYVMNKCGMSFPNNRGYCREGYDKFANKPSYETDDFDYYNDHSSQYLVLANGGLAVGSYGSLPYASVLNRWGTAFGKANMSTGVNGWCIGHGHSVAGHSAMAIGMHESVNSFGQLVIGNESDHLSGPYNPNYECKGANKWSVDDQHCTQGDGSTFQSVGSLSTALRNAFTDTTGHVQHQWVGWTYFDSYSTKLLQIQMTAIYQNYGWYIRPANIVGIYVKDINLMSRIVTGYSNGTYTLGAGGTGITADEIPDVTLWTTPPYNTHAGWIVRNTETGTDQHELNYILLNPKFLVCNIEPTPMHWKSDSTNNLGGIGQAPYRIVYSALATDRDNGIHVTGSDSMPVYPVMFRSMKFKPSDYSSQTGISSIKYEPSTPLAVDYLGNVHTPDGALILKSANKKWKLTVNDSGTLSAVEYTDFTNPFGS